MIEYTACFLSPSAHEVLDLVRVRDLTRHIVAALPPAFTSLCSPRTFFTPTLIELAYDQPVTDATFEEMLGILDVPGAHNFRLLPHKRYLRLRGRTSPVFVRLCPSGLLRTSSMTYSGPCAHGGVAESHVKQMMVENPDASSHTERHTDGTPCNSAAL